MMLVSHLWLDLSVGLVLCFTRGRPPLSALILMLSFYPACIHVHAKSLSSIDLCLFVMCFAGSKDFMIGTIGIVSGCLLCAVGSLLIFIGEASDSSLCSLARRMDWKLGDDWESYGEPLDFIWGSLQSFAVFLGSQEGLHRRGRHEVGLRRPRHHRREYFYQCFVFYTIVINIIIVSITVIIVYYYRDYCYHYRDYCYC